MEHLLRGVRPQGEQLPGNEETSEAKVGKKLENPWDNPIYCAINAFNDICLSKPTDTISHYSLARIRSLEVNVTEDDSAVCLPCLLETLVHGVF